MTDWRAWHEGYDDPASPLSLRLRAVQDEIRAFLASARPGPLRVASACSGLPAVRSCSQSAKRVRFGGSAKMLRKSSSISCAVKPSRLST